MLYRRYERARASATLSAAVLLYVVFRIIRKFKDRFVIYMNT